MDKNRDKKIDALKGFAIILVVMGHIIAFSNLANYNENFLFNLIYSFHMPLFFFISGYLVFGRFGPTTTTWIYKKFRQLIIPYLMFTLFYFYILFGRPIYDFTPVGVLFTFFRYTIPDSAWFLPVLFESFILLALCIICEKKIKNLAFILFFFLFLGVIPLTDLYSLAAVKQIILYTPYVIIGYLVCSNWERISKKILLIKGVGSLLFFILFFIKFYYHVPFSDSILISLYFNYCIAFTGIILSFGLIDFINKIFLLSYPLIICGIFSLEIYLIHLILINYFTFRGWPLWIDSGFTATLSGTIFLTGLSLIIALILSYNKNISTIIFGRWSWKYLSSLKIKSAN